MKLTQDQIQELYKFIRAHYVEHYDLQTELVDHLANGIEGQWEQNPKISFEEAKNREFKKFGIFGFQDVIAERRKSMSKKYRSIIWRYFGEWFQWPKLVFSIFCIVVIAYLLHSLTDENTKQATVFLLCSVLVIVCLGYFFWSRKNRELDMVKGGRKWMLGEMIFGFGSIIHLINLLFQLSLSTIHFKGFIINNVWFDILFSVVWVSICLTAYIAMLVIPSKADEILAETYPEYKISLDYQ